MCTGRVIFVFEFVILIGADFIGVKGNIEFQLFGLVL